MKRAQKEAARLYKRAHFRFSCQPYGFEVEAHGSAVVLAHARVEEHRSLCPYCGGERLPAAEFRPTAPDGRETG